ncbi:MAG: aryl-sulfate sulfohydrolase [Pirellula sp.]|nr:aryl-sulfate sulfohydrolase [Pirellula sp.]
MITACSFPTSQGRLVMKRLVLALLVWWSVFETSWSAKGAPPNILLIVADDMGWNAPSCYGNRDIATPHLDRLAAQGMRFTQAYADSQCSPTRAALFSGQYGARTGVFKVLNEIEPSRALLRSAEANTALTPDVATLATMLRGAGYITGISGKWHIANNPAVAPLRSRDEGRYFDRYGFDFAGEANGAQHHEDKTVTAITDEILGFIEQSRGKPWFAFAAHFSPHSPLEAPQALVDAQAARGYKRATTREGLSSERPCAEYLAMLAHFDAELGRLLARLEERRLAEDTLVIFTSDNGGLSRVTNNAPLREGKGAPYEGGIRVPLIVRWPGHVRAGSECAAPVHTVDFYPTFAAVAGATLPSDRTFDGESLVPLLEQTGLLERPALYWHMPTYTTNFGRTPCAVVREGDWKLIHWFGDYLDTQGFTPDDKPYGKLVPGARTELYNLRDDEGERHNLAAERPRKTAHLRSALDAWWKATGAKLPTTNPDFEPTQWW